MNYDWDYNGDGMIAVDDMLDHYDTNHDGMLDSEELKSLSEQLSSQLEYNNMLLAQIHSLETENAQLQHEAESQQDYVKSSQRNSDGIREELADTKRKLKVTQEIVENLTRQLRECRLENSMLKKDTESTLSNHLKSSSEVEGLKEDIDRLKKALSDAEKLKMQAIDDANGLRQQIRYQTGSLKEAAQNNTKELIDWKLKAHQLETEKNELQENFMQLTNAFDEVNKSYQSEMFHRQQGDRKMKMLIGNMEQLQGRCSELEFSLHDSSVKFEQQKEILEVVNNDKDMLEKKISELEEKQIDFQFSIDSLNETKSDLELTIEKQKHEVSIQMNKVKQDFERQKELLISKQTELSKLLDEAKNDYIEAIEINKQKIAEVEKQKSDIQENNNNLIRQNKELDKVLDRVNHNHQQEIRILEEKIKKGEEAVAEIRGKLLLSEQERDEAFSKAANEKEQSLNNSRAARQKYIKSCERYIEIFNNLQTVVNSLTKECTVGRNRLRDVSNQTSLFKKKINLINESYSTSLISLKTEMLSMCKMIINKQKTTNNKIDKINDELAHQKLKHEEQVAKCLMLEEELSKNEHEKTLQQRRFSQVEKDYLQHFRKHVVALDKMNSEKTALEQKIQELRNSLMEKDETVIGLQETHRQQINEIHDLNTKINKINHDFDAKLSVFGTQISKVQEERDYEKKKSSQLEEELDQLHRELMGTQTNAAVASDNINHIRRESQELLQQKQDALESVEGVNKQYHMQVKQTQELLKVVQQQRSQLQQQNTNLKAEIERLHEQYNVPN